MVKKKITNFRPNVRSRHPSHSNLRTLLPLFPFRSVIRLGSTTDMVDTISNGGNRIEINTVNAVKNSSSKLLMKQCFTDNKVKTAEWVKGNSLNDWKFDFPIVAKSFYGSRGTGNTLIKSKEELDKFIKGKTVNNYIFEKYHNYTREYRLHCTEDGCFYTCRKMLKSDCPDTEKWHRHDDNSIWILEENEQFDKPTNWKTIESECVKALKAVGLDICSFDVKVQGTKDSKGNQRKDPEFIVIECNSASSFGNVTEQKYLETLPKLLMKKWKQSK